MAKESLFRNSIGGYNKDDVNHYIEELGIQYTDRENELEGEIRELKKELEVLPSLIAEKKRAAELETHLKEMNEAYEALQGENAKVKAEFDQKVNELEVLKAETEELKKQLEDDKSAFEKRAEEMLIQIQVQAKAVIDKANETAELIIENAKKRALKLSKHEGGLLSEPAPKKKDGLSDILENHKSKMDSFFSAITKSFLGEGK